MTRPAIVLAAAVLPALCAARAGAQGGWPATRWEAMCEVRKGAWSRACPDPELAAAAEVVERQLESFSRWLNAHGFEPPELARAADGAYPAYFSHETASVFGGRYDIAGRRLVLDAQLYGEDAPEAVVPELFLSVAAAVLVAYKPMDVLLADGNDWLFQSLPHALVMGWWMDQLPAVGYQKHRRRCFDTALHDPPAVERRGTAEFWLIVGLINGQPGGIAHLDGVLRQDWSNSLHAVDAALEPLGGLPEAYLEFLRLHAKGRAFFCDVASEELRLEDGQPETSITLPGRARKVAAGAHELTARAPEDLEVEVEIRINGDHPDLHLIVGGERLDRVAGDDRNVYRTTYAATRRPRKFFVRVANAAEYADDTADQRPYELEFIVRLAPPDLRLLQQDRDRELASGGGREGRLALAGKPLDGRNENLLLRLEVRGADSREEMRRVYQVLLDGEVVFNERERDLAELIRAFEPEQFEPGGYRFALPVEAVEVSDRDNATRGLFRVQVTTRERGRTKIVGLKDYHRVGLHFPCHYDLVATGALELADARDGPIALVDHVTHNDGTRSFVILNHHLMLLRGYELAAGFEKGELPPGATGAFPLRYVTLRRFERLGGGAHGRFGEDRGGGTPAPVLTLTTHTDSWVEGRIQGTLTQQDPDSPPGSVELRAEFGVAKGKLWCPASGTEDGERLRSLVDSVVGRSP